jgi:hypothetical protein
MDAGGNTARLSWVSRLPDARLSRTLEIVEVHLTPEQEARLAQIATNAGTDAERLVKDAVSRLLEGSAIAHSDPSGSVVAEACITRPHQTRSRRLDNTRLRPFWTPLDGSCS